MSLETEIVLGFAIVAYLLWQIQGQLKRPLHEPDLVPIKDTYVLEVRCLTELGAARFLLGDDEMGYIIDRPFQWGTKTEWLEDRRYYYDAEKKTVGWVEFELFKELEAALLRLEQAKMGNMGTEAAASQILLWAMTTPTPFGIAATKLWGMGDDDCLLQHIDPRVIPKMRRAHDDYLKKFAEQSNQSN